MTVPLIFCLPHAGATSAAYRHWSGQAPGVDLKMMDRPGRGVCATTGVDGRDAVQVVRTITGHIREVLQTHSGPWALLGHSFGALLANVVAAELLRREGLTADLVVPSCGAAPRYQRVDDQVADADDESLNEHIVTIGHTPRRALEGPLGQVLRRYFREDQALRSQLSSGDLPVKHSSPMLTVAAGHDAHVAAEEVEHWRAYTSGVTRHMAVAGDHFSVVREPEEVLGQVRDLLRAEHYLQAGGLR